MRKRVDAERRYHQLSVGKPRFVMSTKRLSRSIGKYRLRGRPWSMPGTLR